MQEIFYFSIVFLYATFALAIMNAMHLDYLLVIKIIGVLVFCFLLMINIFGNITSRNKRFHIFGKWLILLISNFLVQLVIHSTGAIYSPFLILFHLFTIALSLLYSFRISLIFLAFSFVNILVTFFSNPDLLNKLLHDPVTVILYFISFLIVIPLAYILAHHYHLKDRFVTVLKDQITIEESILSQLPELVFVTDLEYKILSLNDTVEEVLQRSRSEMLGKPLFEVLLLRLHDGRLVTQEIISKQPFLDTIVINGLAIVSTTSPIKKVRMQIKSIINLEGMPDQLSFIVSSSSNANLPNEDHKSLEEVMTEHEAKVENLRKKLQLIGLHQLDTELLLIKHTEHDILLARTIEDHGIHEVKVRVDVAMLCKETVGREKDFANAFHVQLEFELISFGLNDIKPLVTNIFQISPEQFTGPFFTTAIDVKHIGLILQKLIKLSILLASSESNPRTKVSIERDKQAGYFIRITTQSPQILPAEQQNLYLKKYGQLRGKTNLHFGSGLEGYLAKNMLTELNVPFTANYYPSTSQFAFILHIPKK